MDSNRKAMLVVLAFALHGATLTTTDGQQRNEGSATLLDRLPSALAPHAQSIGDRVLKPGKEKTTLTGELITERGERYPLRVTLQLPDNVRIEGLGHVGESGMQTTNLIEQQLLEVFSSDIPEAMISSTRDGAAVQLLGRYVRSSPAADFPVYDIYEWSGPVRSSDRIIDRLKRFAFDSNTGLLAYTEYLDETVSPPLNVRIRFEDWRIIDGSSYPGRIERLENGHLTFSWKPAQIVASHREDATRR
jgi:hypothetical protein